MRIGKILGAVILCAGLLTGCGMQNSKEQQAPGSVSSSAPVRQVETAVPEKGIPVLMYHMIGNIQNNDAVLSESHLREQMQYLKDHGYHPISLDQLYDYVVRNKPVPVRPVVLTFDDGYKDTYTIVLPLMKEYGFKATVFIPTYDADQGTRLNWQEIKAMKEGGLDIASHSYHHERLSTKSAADMENEIAMSQKELRDQLGITNEFFCYPYGQEHPEVESALRKAGIKMAFTMNPGWAKYGDDPYAVKRIWIGNSVELANFAERISTENYAQR